MADEWLQFDRESFHDSVLAQENGSQSALIVNCIHSLDEMNGE